MIKNKHKLEGLCILNTRPLPQGHQLSEAIMNAGGSSIELPAIEIKPTTTESWLNLLPPLNNVRQAIFISTNAINYFFSGLQKNAILWPTSIPITTIGHASANALKAWHLNAANIPSMADSEHLLQLECLQQVKDQTILLIKGEGGRMDIISTLVKHGASLVSLNVYRRALPNIPPQSLKAVWHNDAVDIILLTSHAAIQNLFLLMGKEAHGWLRNTPCLVISKRLADMAALFGMRTIIVSRYDTILDTLERYKKRMIS